MDWSLLLCSIFCKSQLMSSTLNGILFYVSVVLMPVLFTLEDVETKQYMNT